VTEAEWLASESPLHMRAHLEETRYTSQRKLRLFSVACCRRVSQWFIDPCQEAAVDVMERYAEGISSAEELETASALAAAIPARVDALFMENREDMDADALNASGLTAEAVAEVSGLEGAVDEGEWTYCHSLHGAIAKVVEAAGFGAVADDPLNGRSLPAQASERRVLADFLRCIVGNPIRPVAADPRWLTSDVVAVARVIYDQRAFDRLPILADALQDAGCDHADLLAHCRGPGPHARGCWAVDLVLGKS
jgi:hypothetical protein